MHALLLTFLTLTCKTSFSTTALRRTHFSFSKQSSSTCTLLYATYSTYVCTYVCTHIHMHGVCTLHNMHMYVRMYIRTYTHTVQYTSNNEWHSITQYYTERCAGASQLAVAGKHPPCPQTAQQSPSTQTAAPGQTCNCLHRIYVRTYVAHPLYICSTWTFSTVR